MTLVREKRIGIVGAGLMGMALAYKLAADGHRVTIIEHSDQPGGLATWHDYGEFSWDKFYHVILPSDKNLIGLIKELGMGDDLQWQRTYTGFFVANTLHSLSSNVEFLKFPLLSLVSKARLGFTMLYASRINHWQKLETLSCERWLRRVSGDENVDKLWKPLLLAKLGPNYQRVSAVFIWSYIKRLFSARDKSASAEQLGHVKGGYQSIFAALQTRIESSGGTLKLNEPVMSISPATGGGIEIKTKYQQYTFDQVVCTSPVSVLKQIVATDMIKVGRRDDDIQSHVNSDIKNPLDEIEYLGVVCVVIISKKPLTHYYVINIADEAVPFTGVIGMSNVVSPKNTAGYHVTYLPRYMLSTDPELQKPDAYFKEQFLKGLSLLFPEFDKKSVIDVHVNKAMKVQPLQVLNYSKIVPSVQTYHDRLHVLNTSQFVNATLNNNEVIGAVNAFHQSFTSNLLETESA